MESKQLGSSYDTISEHMNRHNSLERLLEVLHGSTEYTMPEIADDTQENHEKVFKRTASTSEHRALKFHTSPRVLQKQTASEKRMHRPH